MNKLILLGGGGHCESVIEVILGLPNYNIVGILDPGFNEYEEKKILGFPIVGRDNDIERYVEKGCKFVITVGQIKSSSIREKLYDLVISNGGELPVIIANSARVSSSAKISDGTVILQNAVVNANSKIGICSIVNTGAIIEHGCYLGNFSHVATGVILNGDVNCGNSSFIGSGTVVNQGVKIQDNVIIASGSVVRKNIDFGKTYGGNPLKEIS